MSDLAVKTIFEAKGDILKVLDKMDRKVDKFGRSSNRAFKKASRGASEFKSVFKGILAAGAVQKGLGLISRGIGSIVTDFIDLDQAATGAAVRFKDIGPNATDLSDRILEIKNVAREMGGKTEKSFVKMGTALNFLAKAGWDSRNAFKALGPLVDISTATGEDFSRVADIASDLMGSFSLSVKEPGQNLKNLNRLLDVLTSTSNSANVTIEDMFLTMKQIGPIAKGILKVSLEEVAAVTGLMGDNAQKGGDAMTSLRAVYIRLAAPPTEAAKALKLLNIQMKDATGQPKKLGVVFGELKKSMEGLDPTDKAAFLFDIFGKTGLAGSQIILDNLDILAKKEKAALDVKGITKDTAGVLRKTTKNRIEELKSTISELALKVISPFEDDIKAGISRLTKFFRETDVTPFVEDIKGLVDKIKTFDMSKLEGFPKVISDNINLAIKAVQDFDRTINNIFTSTKPILDFVNSLIVGESEEVKKEKRRKADEFIKEKQRGITGIPGVPTPQETEAKSRAQQLSLSQNINIHGAQKGSTVDVQTKAAPQLAFAGVGANTTFNH